MSIRPVEFQVSIPKTFEASKEQQNFLKRGDIDAQQKNMSLNDEINKKMSSVNDTDKTEKQSLKNDSEGKNKEEQKEKTKKNNDSDLLNNDEDISFAPGKLDIKI